MYPKGTKRITLSVDVSVLNRMNRQPVSLKGICVSRIARFRFEVGVRDFFNYIVKFGGNHEDGHLAASASESERAVDYVWLDSTREVLGGEPAQSF